MQQRKTGKRASTEQHKKTFVDNATMNNDSSNYRRFSSILSLWSGKSEFLVTQLKMLVVLAFAYVGNTWDPSYERNENHNMSMFWLMNLLLVVGAFLTWTHKPPSNVEKGKVTLLSREQTEEWKGWMQWAFIMYHYYRAFSAYNWIRVFVSSYVWMTGFGNYLYFEKTGDFSLKRVVGMVIRINYFPLILALAMSVSIDLYYVVPLHTVGFFITMLTCYIGQSLEGGRFGVVLSYRKSRITAIVVVLIMHVLFYETRAVNFLQYFSHEIYFRFQADKYSAWLGILSGMCMSKASEYMDWAYGGDNDTSKINDSSGFPNSHNAEGESVDTDNSDKVKHVNPIHATSLRWAQRILGTFLIFVWYKSFGYLSDKLEYNPVHPYIFILPLLGWLMIRNSSRRLTESHSTLLEFLGRNTLETYVLQFHVFMNHGVQHIPVIIPGADYGSNGNGYARFANMILCGVVFVALAVWARKLTVSTQKTVTDLIKLLNVDAPTQRGNYDIVSTKDNDNTVGAVSAKGTDGLELVNVSANSQTSDKV